MKTKLVTSLLSVCFIAGSVAAAGETLYPFQGPLATQAPPPRMTATFHGTGSGKFILLQAHGETFQGKWASLVPSFVNTKTPETAASYLPQPNLAFAWDAVYGQGYFLAQILGTRIRQVLVTGDQGTVIQVECQFAVGRSAFNGVAVDSRGNIYKVAW